MELGVLTKKKIELSWHYPFKPLTWTELKSIVWLCIRMVAGRDCKENLLNYLDQNLLMLKGELLRKHKFGNNS